MDHPNQDAVAVKKPRIRLTLEERAAQLRAEAELLDNRAKKAALKKGVDVRNCQARQIGYWVLDHLKKKGHPLPAISTWADLVALLDPFLVPDAHRAYFDLSPLSDDDERKGGKS